MKAGLLQEAISHHQAGELQQAALIYQQILEVEPVHQRSVHLWKRYEKHLEPLVKSLMGSGT